MNKGVIVLVLALLPLAASAQAPIPSIRPPTAQSGPLGIYVTGQGAVRYPVKSLRFNAYTRGNVDEASVLAAMRAAGVDDPTVGPAQSVVGPNTPILVRGTLRDVSRP